MPDHVVDYSWARPDAAELRKHFVGAARYLGFGPGKLLTAGERDRLHAAGLVIALVFESSGSRMNGGAPAGDVDAHTANIQADYLSYPDDRPIFFANDQNACTAAHIAYMKAAKAASKRPVGPYGSTALVDACTAFGCLYGWKVSTWGKPTTNASLQQMPNVRSPIPGTDMNYALKPDWGQWPFAGTWPVPGKDEEMRRWLVHAPGSVEVYQTDFTAEGTESLANRPELLKWLQSPYIAPGLLVDAQFHEIPKAVLDDLLKTG